VQTIDFQLFAFFFGWGSNLAFLDQDFSNQVYCQPNSAKKGQMKQLRPDMLKALFVSTKIWQ
jgi:hypothetical protein